MTLDAARAHRAQGWGWQTIAQVLRVNRIDLQRACGEIDAVAAGPTRGPPPPRAPQPSASPAALVPIESRAPDLRPLGAGSAGLEVLGLLCAGRATIEGLAAATGLDLVNVRPAVGRLLGKRLIVPVGLGEFGATAWGEEVHDLSLKAAGGRPVALTKLDRALVVLADGAEHSVALSAALEISIPNAAGVLGRLRELGLARSRDNPADKGAGGKRRLLWRLTQAGAARATELKAAFPHLGASNGG